MARITKLYNSTYDRLISNGKLFDNRWEYLTKKYIIRFVKGTKIINI
jgi:hypothetical protein